MRWEPIECWSSGGTGLDPGGKNLSRGGSLGALGWGLRCNAESGYVIARGRECSMVVVVLGAPQRVWRFNWA